MVRVTGARGDGHVPHRELRVQGVGIWDSRFLFRVKEQGSPPWMQPRGTSEVNLPQMLPPGGSIRMGVD